MTTELTGALVYADRKKRGMSRAKYADLVGLTQNKIMNIEQGRVIRTEEAQQLNQYVFGQGGAGLDDRDYTHPDSVVVVRPGLEGLQPIEVIPADAIAFNQAQPPTYLLDEEDEDDDEPIYIRAGGVTTADDIWIRSLPSITDDGNIEGIEEFENENGEVTSFPPTLEGDEDSVGGWFTSEPVEEVSIHEADTHTEIVELAKEADGVPVQIREKYEFALPGYHLSNSELQTFKRCHRKWWLTYYRELRLQRPDVTGPRAIGSRGHLALSAYYAEPPQNMWDVFEASAEIDRAKVADDPETLATLEKEIELCHIMLQGYLEWLEETGADDGLEVVGNEEVVEVPFTEILGTPVVLVGKLDLRVKRDGDNLRLFEDHKFIQSLENPTLHIDEQLLQYQLLEYLQFLERGEGEYAVGGLYNMLRKVKRTAAAKPPFYARVEVRHNMNDLKSYWLRIYGEATAILELRAKLDEGQDPRQVAYPSPRRDCSWDCDFFPVCPMFDDGSAAEDMLTNLYEAHDPHDHYYVESADETTTDA
jgi:transcriptional regulator with XRE-family HTH domain